METTNLSNLNPAGARLKRGRPKKGHRPGASARKSCQMYNEGMSVKDIAVERGLVETTVWGHLFQQGVADPDAFISRNLFERATMVYDSGVEDRHLLLDSFLTPAAKAAFYFLRRKETNENVKS